MSEGHVKRLYVYTWETLAGRECPSLCCACRATLPPPPPLRTARDSFPSAAQAFTNVLAGRGCFVRLLARGSADDSWHETTPSCPPCPDRLRCPPNPRWMWQSPLRSAAVDRTPGIVPLEPSLKLKSGCDLSAFGPVPAPPCSRYSSHSGS